MPINYHQPLLHTEGQEDFALQYLTSSVTRYIQFADINETTPGWRGEEEVARAPGGWSAAAGKPSMVGKPIHSRRWHPSTGKLNICHSSLCAQWCYKCKQRCLAPESKTKISTKV